MVGFPAIFKALIMPGGHKFKFRGSC